MNLFRRFTALLLAVLLVTGLFPVHAVAEEQEPLTFETTYINPIYADMVSEEDIPPVVAPRVQTYETVHYVTTVEEAGIVLREQMKARMEAPVVHIFANISTSEEFSALCNDIYEVAKAHTLEPNEGDYILWHLSGYKASGKRYTAEGGYNIDITYSMVYHSNAEQEAAVDAAVEELLSQLNLSGRSDYEKVKAVYDYICKNVRYDNTSSGTLKHTAYAALVKKTAVCQGYASLLYRLLLELGVDTRVIAGSTSNGDHGWNIVELDNLYYNADSTWDEGNTSYSWFLKSPDNFPNHNRFAEYTTAAFTSAYPMASADYVPHPHHYSTAVTAPTCTEDGFTTYTCSCGDTYKDNYVDATDHSFGNWYETKAPTETEEGEEKRDCEKCDHYETREVEKLPSSDPYSGTCGENLTWVFDTETGALTISGTGDMYHYGYADSALPWTEFSSQILTVTLEEGVASLGENSLYLCDAMTQLNLPASLANVPLNALPATGALTAINVDPDNPDYFSDSGVLYDANFNALVKYPMSKADESYTLHDSTSIIALFAFGNCNNLQELFFTGHAPQIDETAFTNTILTAYYPAGDSTYTEDGMLDYGGTITWKPYCPDQHVWNEGTVTREPTCTQPGYTDYTCTACDTTKTEEIPATGHSWGTGVVTKEPTDTQPGIRAYSCTACGEQKTEEIPVHEHEYVPEVTDPTCTQQGYTTYTCSCGDSFVGNYVDPTEHNWDSGKITQEPTETETGIRTYTCLTCGEHLFEKIPVLEHTHDYEITITAPTCTEQGYTTYVCGCGHSYVDNYVDATGHSFGSWYETKAPTETATGLEQRDCNNCDHFETRVVAKLDPTNPSGTCGDNLTWVFDEETGTLTISGTGEMEEYGYTTENNDARPWSFLKDQIEHAVIANGVTSISNSAFYKCTKLEDIDIPKTVSYIGGNAFNECTSLVEISIPEGITTISYNMFINCSSLQNIVIPESVTYIADHVFCYCTSLRSISIPDTVTVISDGCFIGCSSLVDINIPKNLTSIRYRMFDSCSSLNNLVIPASVTTFEERALSNCSNLKTVTFEGNAPTIDVTSFENVITAAYYPANNPTWTSDVMQDYGGDITWVAYSDAPATSGTCGDNLTWNFDETSGQLTVSGSGAMYGAGKLGWTAFAGDIRSVEIGNGATSVGAYAFADCENLTDVQMPNSVMSIAYNAFENCSSLTAVDIPDNVTEIAYGAFMDCSSLTAVDIPDNVTEISYSAFKDCTSLTSLELPQNVMSISYHAFDNCTSLSEVDFPTSLASICDEAFGSCTDLDEMRFTGNAPEIQSKAFSKVTADAYYPADNTTWTSDVLQNYGGSLTWIAEGGSVTPDNSCGENITWAFEESTGTLTISGKETMARSNGISVMDDYARPEDAPWFKYRDQIITVIIEGTVDSIGKNAFAGCSNLTTVIIEEGVSEIDDTAFSDCDALENCYFEGTEEQWKDLGADIGESTLHTESAKPEAHTETKKTVAPTCTEQGYDLYTCSCGTIRKDNFTDPAGHKWNDGVVTREPSAQAPGIRTFTCTVCKATRTETIPYEAPVSDSVYRISGKDRVKTALSVAKALKDTLKVDKFDSVIIATGVNEKFADALSGSYLANRKKAPILLYTNSGLSPLNVNFIKENLKANGTVYILGGDSAVPTTVEKTLSAYNVVRLSGKTRYETNLAILKEAGISGNEILVATGTNFADSLSASAVGLPLLLVNGKNTAPNAVQTEFLKSVAGKKITIIGGDSAVSEEMKASIEKITGVTAERISGKTRHNTSVLIAQKYFPNADFALITYAKNFPDGLAGGPLAYAMGAPLLLTNAGQEGIANGYITAGSIERGYVLGGDSAVSDETARKVFGLAADAAIEKAYYTE